MTLASLSFYVCLGFLMPVLPFTPTLMEGGQAPPLPGGEQGQCPCRKLGAATSWASLWVGPDQAQPQTRSTASGRLAP